MKTGQKKRQVFSLGAYVDDDGTVRVIAYGGRTVKEWCHNFNKYLKPTIENIDRMEYVPQRRMEA